MTSEVIDRGHDEAHDHNMNETTAIPTDTIEPDTAHDERRDCPHVLRGVLRANALNSIVFGALLATIPNRIDRVLGTGHPGWIRVVGLGLIPFGAMCAWSAAASPATRRRITPQIVVADVVWVVASVVTVLLGWYSGRGIVAVLAMAAIVGLFALLQWHAWRRLQVTH